MLTDGSIYDDNMTLLQAYHNLEKRVKALEAGGGGGGSYTLPTASATVKGGVKIGSGLQMNGEVLSTTGGGGGGSTSFIWDSAETRGDEDGLSNPPEGFILGWGVMLSLPLNGQYTEAIVATNIEDETDTKTFYLPNTTLPDLSDRYTDFNFSNGTEPLNLIPLRLENRYGHNYISTPDFQNRYPLYPLGGLAFSVYDTDDQSEKAEDTRYYAQVLSEEVEPVGYASLTVGGLSPNLYPTLNGYITEMNIVDSVEEKTYHWEGSIPYGDVLEASSYGAWKFYYQYLEAQTA